MRTRRDAAIVAAMRMPTPTSLTLFLALATATAQAPLPPVQTATPAVPAPTAPELSEQAFAALHELKADKAPAPTGTAVKLGDQQHYLALPKTGKAPFPAVLLIHEWWGLNDHIRHWADRMAGEGYATLAVDLYGGKAATTPAEASAMMKAVDATQAAATLHAAFEFLASDPRILASKRASLGWCFGGAWSLQVAIAEPKLDACVLYYGRLVDDPAKLATIQAPVLGVFGTRDPSIPQPKVDAFAAAMQKAGKACRVLRYDAEHAFANPSGAKYDQKNAAAAWAEVRAFLRERLVAPAPASKATDAGK